MVQFMDSSWVIALIGFAAGAIISIILYRFMSSSDNQAHKLEQDLSALTKEYDNYKTEVSEHFNKTSKLVGDLTSNYVEVYKHLSSGAIELADIQTAELLITQQPQNDDSTELTDESVNSPNDSKFEQPKDYAPKEQGTEGTLSESFSTGAESKQN